MTIYKQMIQAGVEVANHESDLYVPVNETTTKIVENSHCKHSTTKFLNQLSQSLWYDIPFAYDPFWRAKERQ